MKKTRLLEIIREEIQLALQEASTTYAGKTAIDDLKKDPKYSTLSGDGKTDAEEKLKSGGTVTIGEENLNEMAKIAGDLKSAIEKVIKDNPDLEGLALKKKIKADKAVDDALEGETLYDNQLNKFIAAAKVEREIGQLGRKADPNKVKPEPKEPGQRGRKPSAEKSTSTDMDDEDKEAAKSAEKDSTAKALASTPEEKKEKFNLGLKFIKKYKDDKSKVDAYLKKAKEEYKFTKYMIDDLKRAAGREVEA
jgi:hypothetical protein